MKLLMCRPDFFGVEYEINPWMDIKNLADHLKAQRQWITLYDSLKSCHACHAHIELIEPISGWPDMTFTANAGLYFKDKIILSHFKFKERQGEISYFKTWFENHGLEIWNPHADTEPFFEGAGDALPAGEMLFAAYGFRSQREFYEQASYLDQNKLIYCELINPYFYHLDTCFCPLTAELAIWYPDAFSKESQIKMSKEIELITVNENEAKRFACNAVALNDHVMLADGCPELTALLTKRGYQIHAFDMSEFLKAGGACKCLTLRID